MKDKSVFTNAILLVEGNYVIFPFLLNWMDGLFGSNWLDYYTHPYCASSYGVWAVKYVIKGCDLIVGIKQGFSGFIRLFSLLVFFSVAFKGLLLSFRKELFFFALFCALGLEKIGEILCFRYCYSVFRPLSWLYSWFLYSGL